MNAGAACHFTPGPWRRGHSGCVVADTPISDRTMGERDVAYYGGELICESIGTVADASLIAAAPSLLTVVKHALLFIQHSGLGESVRGRSVSAELSAVIDNAEGRT